jgi:hypothetical protein
MHSAMQVTTKVNRSGECGKRNMAVKKPEDEFVGTAEIRNIEEQADAFPQLLTEAPR